MPNRFSALLRKEYAVIRFHRHGVLAPDYAVISPQEALLARIKKRAEQGYSFAFWLKNLQTQNDVFASAGSGEYSFCTRIFKPKGEQPFFFSARRSFNEQAKLR